MLIFDINKRICLLLPSEKNSTTLLIRLRKIEAIYKILEDEIEQSEWEYSDEFKAELNSRYDYYKNGGKMITAEEANERIDNLMNKNQK